jgi:hypothetical protein
MAAFLYLGEGTADQTHIYLIIAGIVIIAFVLLRRSVRETGKNTDRDRPRPGTGQRTSQLEKSLKGDTEKLLVELQEFGREIEGRLETRIQHLTKLIAEADKEIERLNALVTASRSEAAARETGANEAAEIDPDGGIHPLKERILALSEQGLDPFQIAATVGKPLGEVELFLGLGRNIRGKNQNEENTGA